MWWINDCEISIPLRVFRKNVGIYVCECQYRHMKILAFRYLKRLALLGKFSSRDVLNARFTSKNLGHHTHK
jgi:hypothetical protein